MTRYKDRFHQAARDGYLDLLRDATRRECDTADDDGMTPVLWASFYGNLDALRLLISRGGDPDKTDYLGNSSLHFASANGHMPCVTFLVNFGANIWTLDNDFHSPLDVASLREHRDIVEFLDSIISKQYAMNRRVVLKMRERAAKSAQKRCKQYEKMMKKTNKKLIKEEKHLQKNGGDVTDGNSTIIALRNKQQQMRVRRLSSGTESIKSFENGTVVHHNSGQDIIVSQSATHQATPKTYSDYVTGSRKNFKMNVGAAKKAINRKMNSDADDKRSLSTFPGDADIAYGVSRSFDGRSILSGPTSEPDFSVLPGGANDASGLFERPGFGSVAFFHRPRMTDALNSLNHNDKVQQQRNHPDSSTYSPSKNTHLSYADSIGTSRSLIMRQWKDLPWSEEDLLNLEDDTTAESSDLELFLACLGLTDYIPVFNKEQLDLEALLLCTDSDLQSLGLPLGPRKKILEGVARRKDLENRPHSLQDLKL